MSYRSACQEDGALEREFPMRQTLSNGTLREPLQLQLSRPGNVDPVKFPVFANFDGGFRVRSFSRLEGQGKENWDCGQKAERLNCPWRDRQRLAEGGSVDYVSAWPRR